MESHLREEFLSVPERVLEKAIAEFNLETSSRGAYLFRSAINQTWLKKPSKLYFEGLWILRRNEFSDVDISVALRLVPSTGDFEDSELLNGIEDNFNNAQNNFCELENIGEFFKERGLFYTPLNSPLILSPVEVPKPWGKEIWYTGVEERGVCSVVGNNQILCPLPVYMSLSPTRLSRGVTKPLVLLKILDPYPEAVFGDLYFEIHRKKREVYVVSKVDSEAWPDGVGGLKLGFNFEMTPPEMAKVGFEKYLQSVKNYENIRRKIDVKLDHERVSEGFSETDVVPLSEVLRWHSKLDRFLLAEERNSREIMDGFIHMHQLKLGDIVPVPLGVPHALQHGVQVVEFQTPVYERLILSYAQKVLTQDSWDTDAALEFIKVTTPTYFSSEVIEKTSTFEKQLVASFEDFYCWRGTLMPDGSSIEKMEKEYLLLFSLSDGLSISFGNSQKKFMKLNRSEAVFIPYVGGDITVAATAEGHDVFQYLCARPA